MKQGLTTLKNNYKYMAKKKKDKPVKEAKPKDKAAKPVTINCNGGYYYYNQ